jgi:hypothetical protein
VNDSQSKRQEGKGCKMGVYVSMLVFISVSFYKNNK